MKLQQVHLRVNDAATGKPTPVRLRVTDEAGNYYAPHGRLADFVSGSNQEVGGNVYIGTKPWAYIDGACEILLSPGTLRFEISKGPEFQPVDTPVHLLAGKLALRFDVERWSDVRKEGWYSGDTRVHFLPPHAALLEGRAEDLAVVNLLATETTAKDRYGKVHSAIPHLEAFSGQTFAIQSPECGVAVNSRNTHPELGSVGLLHCHRTVYPLSFGGPAGKEDWTLEDWCDQCHRKKGLVVWTNPQHQSLDFLYGEPLANLIASKIDAFEVVFWEDSPFDVLLDYYRLLDADLVAPLAGASGKESNGLALGGMRTYAYLPAGETFDYTRWIEAVRQGRTYVSNGPLLHFTIDGEVPMTHRVVGAPSPSLHLKVEAKSVLPFEHVEILWNGEVIAEVGCASVAPYHAVLEATLPVQNSGWLAARCRGKTQIPSRPGPQRVFAHTSAVAVRKPPQDSWAKPEAVNRLLGEIECMLRWAEGKARCDTPRERARLVQVFERARAKLRLKLPA